MLNERLEEEGLQPIDDESDPSFRQIAIRSVLEHESKV